MPRIRLPPSRLPVLLVVVVTVSLGLHHYAFHSPAPQRVRLHSPAPKRVRLHSPAPQRVRRNEAVPEMFSAPQRMAEDGGGAKLRSASDDTAPRVKPLLSSNIIPNNTVIERSDHEGSVLTNSTTTRRKHFSTSQPPPCALSSTVEICEEDNEYDEEVAHAIRVALRNSRVGALLQNPVVNSLLHDSTFTEEDASPSSQFALRVGHGVDWAPACRSRQVSMDLMRARNKHGTWFYVIHQDNIFQTIVFETCLSSDDKCHLGCDAPPTVQTTCKQLYIFRKKLVLDDAGLGVMEEDLLIPSCCACFISHADGVESGQ